jgi:hypothetical protein
MVAIRILTLNKWLVVQGLGVLMAAIFLAGQMAGVGVLALPAALIVTIFSQPFP